MSELPGRIGRYEILDLVGRGAMGVVYRARDPLIGRVVAIKMVASSAVLPPDSQAEFKERFFREAQTAGNLHHPNIVTIYDLGEEGGVPFMAQGFVEGESLSARLRRGPLPAPQALAIARQVAEGLAYAHQRGVIHRDIKPDNILLDEKGRAVITDFGIARISASELTRTGEVLGTPTFMSPEQVRGEDLDARSDLFSLGVVLYTMLSGQRPFRGDTISSVCYQVVHGEPKPSVRELALPPALTRILDRLLAKDRDARYATAEEVAAELAEASGRTQAFGPQVSQAPPASEHDQTVPASGAIRPIQPPPEPSPSSPAPDGAAASTTLPPPAPSGKRRRGWLLAAGAAFLLLLGLIGLVAAGRMLRTLKERAPEKEPPAAVSPAEPPATPPAQAPAGPGDSKGDEARMAETPSSGPKPKGAPVTHGASPDREAVPPLLFVALGPLSMGQVQVTVDGKAALHSPMAPASGAGGGSGFLVAERLTLTPGPHEVRMALAAAKPGPFYAEATKQVVLEAGPEQVLIVRAARFPARLQVTGPTPRSSIPRDLETAIQERMAAGGPGAGQALAGAAELFGQGEPAVRPISDWAQIHVLMDGPLQEGQLRLFLDGEEVASRRLEELPKPSDRPGFHFEGKVGAKPGAHLVRVVLEGVRPRPFQAEGERSFTLQPGQRLKLRAEMERFPPRLVLVEVGR